MKKKKHPSSPHKLSRYNIIFTALAPLLVWMVVIFLLSARQRIPLTQSYALSFVIFKTAHLIEYAVLYALWFRLFYKLEFKNSYALAFVCTVLYATSDEFHQTFVPTREGHVRDVLIDTLGTTISYFVISSISFIRKRLVA